MEVQEFDVIAAVVCALVGLTNWCFFNQKGCIQQTAEASIADQVKGAVGPIADECNLKIAGIEERLKQRIAGVEELTKQRLESLYETAVSLSTKVNANAVAIDTLKTNNQNLHQKSLEVEGQCDELRGEIRTMKRDLADDRREFENKPILGLGMMTDRSNVMP